MSGYFIIEHPTRGILKDEPNRDTGKPSFGLEMRSDERAARFFNLRSAIHTLTQTPGMPDGCVIRSSVDIGGRAWRIAWPPERRGGL
jgi:hypothetical protein